MLRGGRFFVDTLYIASVCDGARRGGRLGFGRGGMGGYEAMTPGPCK